MYTIIYSTTHAYITHKYQHVIHAIAVHAGHEVVSGTCEHTSQSFVAVLGYTLAPQYRQDGPNVAIFRIVPFWTYISI